MPLTKKQRTRRKLKMKLRRPQAQAWKKEAGGFQAKRSTAHRPQIRHGYYS